jgi:hypothetical protein
MSYRRVEIQGPGKVAVVERNDQPRQPGCAASASSYAVSTRGDSAGDGRYGGIGIADSTPLSDRPGDHRVGLRAGGKVVKSGSRRRAGGLRRTSSRYSDWRSCRPCWPADACTCEVTNGLEEYRI